MKQPSRKQPNAQPTDGYSQIQAGGSDSRHFPGHSPPQRRHSGIVFLAGFLAAILLSALAYLLIIKTSSQNTVAPTSSSLDQTGPEAGSLINETGLNLEAQHPNGTILGVEGIAFDSNRTIVQLTIANTRESKKGRIRLNTSWGNNPNTMILKDDFGQEYPLIPSGGNSNIEVNPGTTLTGEFSFKGRMNPSTQTVTLVTNSKGGSPSHPISQTPLIEVTIPVNRTLP